VDHIQERGQELFELACARDLEGIVAKHRLSRYTLENGAVSVDAEVHGFGVVDTCGVEATNTPFEFSAAKLTLPVRTRTLWLVVSMASMLNFRNPARAVSTPAGVVPNAMI